MHAASAEFLEDTPRHGRCFGYVVRLHIVSNCAIVYLLSVPASSFVSSYPRILVSLYLRLNFQHPFDSGFDEAMSIAMQPAVGPWLLASATLNHPLLPN